MIKRLITWLYERYCQEPEYIPTPEDYARYRLARDVHHSFVNAARMGKPKPDHPKQINGWDLTESAKKHLDAIYDNAKLSSASVVAGRIVDAVDIGVVGTEVLHCNKCGGTYLRGGG